MQSTSLQALKECLHEKHAVIQSLEKKAKKALYEDNDEACYRNLMQDRAEVISSLGDVCKEILESLPAQVRDSVEDDLDRFAAGAKNALRIGSIFYMSALLYPDDHKEGEPDNLERLINSLADSQG